jgi:NhaP-type Na+/H+ or K+/H+ antiporter
MKLPSKNQHMSDQTAEHALMLQQGDHVIDKAVGKAANESLAIAKEAAASKKSIQDTNEAVSAVLNDPTSVEARTCCTSIMKVYNELCSTDDEEAFSDKWLFMIVLVLACCGMVKSLIRHFRILWLPEAAGCILVGVLSGYVLMFTPYRHMSFDGNWFLRILVPPIIFEAALSIDKRSFKRHFVPIIIYAVVGTLVATIITALVVHYGTGMFSGWCIQIPYVEALTFGALISSIDPIAVLSVLSNMGMTDTDTIYVLIFGESLLNDGVAIVLFHTLEHFLDENLIIDGEAVSEAIKHFFVVAVGSLLVGVASGMLSTVYFWVFHGCQTPLVEVLMFFCWALLPYYVCDGIGWSGIVAAVAVGFVMDLYIVGQWKREDHTELNDMSDHSISTVDLNGDSGKPVERGRRRIFNSHGHLSTEARTHIGFVTEIISTLMETAIFAYLGLFLFSNRYHWNFFHAFIAVLACCISRAVMIPSLGFVANGITRFQQSHGNCRLLPPLRSRESNPAGVVIDRKMQVALWFAGLRGAMSFALVEHIPLYDAFTGEGTRVKAELKAMTSASIMFTVFVLGGCTYYVMDNLGIAPKGRKVSASVYEIAALTAKGHNSFDDDSDTEDRSCRMGDSTTGIWKKPKQAFRRQRVKDVENVLTI